MERHIYTKSILTDRDPEEATHVSVMSRHTLNDGVTPDDRIIEGKSFDEWIKEFAPPAKLVGAYYQNKIGWDEYEEKYLEYLRSEEVQDQLRKFAERCKKEPITLLCVEEDPSNCHRRILAEEIQRIEPSLTITHK